MAKQKEVKTNAMRILESMKIPFTHYTYECDAFVDGLQIADKLSLPYEKVYKTLVAKGSSKNALVYSPALIKAETFAKVKRANV